MTPEKQLEIEMKFPFISRSNVEPNSRSQWDLWGFQMNDGFSIIAEEYLSNVEKLFKNKNIPLSDFRILQCKQKWSEFRIYATYPAEVAKEMVELARLAREKSKRTCEVCSTTQNAVIRKNLPNVQVLCPLHFQQAKERYEQKLKK